MCIPKFLQVLVCGDLRGNLVLFPLSRDLLLCMSNTSCEKISPLSYFKGAHGISSLSSISVARLSCNQIEIRSVWSKFLGKENVGIITLMFSPTLGFPRKFSLFKYYKTEKFLVKLRCTIYIICSHSRKKENIIC